MQAQGLYSEPTNYSTVFLTVYLSNNDQHFTEVPVTPETLCRDVLELCKEPGEAECHLAEVWRGSAARAPVSPGPLSPPGPCLPRAPVSPGPLSPPGPCLPRAPVSPGPLTPRASSCPGPCLPGPLTPLTPSCLVLWLPGPLAQEPCAARGAGRESAVNGERPVGDGERMLDVLQRWGQHRAEVRFYLRHDRTPSRESGRSRGPEPKRNGVKGPADRRLENGVSGPRMDMTLVELQDMATRQQQQIETQQQLLATKGRLKKVRALKGQVEQKRLSNGKLVEEMEQMNGLFQQKQRELAVAASRLRNKLNQEQSSKLQQQRDGLNKRNQEVAAMDKRLGELRERLWKKKAALQHKENVPPPPPGHSEQTSTHNGVKERAIPGRPPTAPVRGPRGAAVGAGPRGAVGPYIQSSTVPGGLPGTDLPVKPAHPDSTATLPAPDPQGKTGPEAMFLLKPLKELRAKRKGTGGPAYWRPHLLEALPAAATGVFTSLLLPPESLPRCSYC
ncbi:hypothetical protein CRUP_016804 [Coryphaenoides rupestris]|nr:hypothetical protein CRUP_016804 [Coryphaenoides rupestris]